MQIHGIEGELVRELKTHHYHSRNPEEENVKAGLKKSRGIEGLEIGRLVGPAENGEGEKTRGEPGIKNILVSLQNNVLLGTSKRLGCLFEGLL